MTNPFTPSPTCSMDYLRANERCTGVDWEHHSTTAEGYSFRVHWGSELSEELERQQAEERRR